LIRYFRLLNNRQKRNLDARLSIKNRVIINLIINYLESKDYERRLFMISVKDLISQKAIRSRFQPVISLRSRSIIGFEALSYAVHADTHIDPFTLFESAAKESLLLSIDRECRSTALSTYQTGEHKNSLLLFLNFESSLIDENIVGSGVLYKQCQDAGISPESVVLEIVESKVHNESALKHFVDIHREKGFVIAIDDVGEGYSNMNRIALLRPDILKADRSLASGIDSNYMKQEIVSSLAKLSSGIGALFLLEGVETELEALTAFGLGVDLMQGYYFSKPHDIHNTDHKKVLDLVQKTSLKAREKALLNTRDHNRFVNQCFTYLESVTCSLSGCGVDLFDDYLTSLRENFQGCECYYILDDYGIQVTDTILTNSFPSKVRPATVFSPARKGSDHSLKDYFFSASRNNRRYVTEHYISLASGTDCITLTVPFMLKTHDAIHYLCADFAVCKS